jgi:hypothetical protein
MKLFPLFKNRAFGAMLQPGLNLQVESCSYSILGGPSTARLIARCPQGINLDQLVSLLRCPVELWTDAGRLAWWGLAWSMRVQDGQVGAQVTLDDLANRVQVAYGEMSSVNSGGGTRQTTPWLDDLPSQASYGVKEAQLQLLMSNQTQAQALRAVGLAKYARPTLRTNGLVGADLRVRPSSGPYGHALRAPEGEAVVIELRGWWSTLDWKYYAAASMTIENYNQMPIWAWDTGLTGIAEVIGQRISIPAAPWYVTAIWLPMARIADVASNIVVNFCADSTGLPGAVLASGTYPGASLPLVNYNWIKVTFNPGYLVTAPGDYWFTVGDSAPLVTSHYRIKMDAGAHYAGGYARYYNGATWLTYSPDCDFQFRLGFTQETTEQIRAMVTTAGQFLTGLRIETSSALYTSPYRSGDTTALQEITRHIQAGTGAGGALTAEVTPERVLAIKSKADPAAGSAFKIGRDGVIRLPTGAPAAPGPGVAGAWADLDVPWILPGLTTSLTPGKTYLENVVFESCSGMLRAMPATSS